MKNEFWNNPLDVFVMETYNELMEMISNLGNNHLGGAAIYTQKSMNTRVRKRILKQEVYLLKLMLKFKFKL